MPAAADIQLFKLDAEGKRAAQGTIGEDMTFSGHDLCRQSMGDRRCVGEVSGDRAAGTANALITRSRAPGRTVSRGTPLSRRTAPLAGSEETLRQYIEALGRGEPNYDRMTSEVAAQTRQQLPFNQAILSRLGALRAMSFRGVRESAATSTSAQFRQRFGGMADRPGQGRHDRTNCVGSAVLVVQIDGKS